jgi:lipid A 3-O-deacylase
LRRNEKTSAAGGTHFLRLLLMCLVYVVALESPAAAQRPSWSVQWENDAFPEWGDDGYTNGLRVSADFGRAKLWGRLARKYKDCLDEAVRDAPCRRTSFMFGQNFYTPNDIARADAIEGDRPYGAWLYGAMAARIVQTKRLTSIELHLGVTGKAAGGEYVQRNWHALPFIGARDPKGWDHQVKGRLGLVGILDHRVARERLAGSTNPFVIADVIPYVRADVGNIFTHAAAGSVVRFGYNVQRKWVDKIGPVFSVASASRERLQIPQERRWEAHVFSGAEVRAIAWNALLQGETYTPRGALEIRRGVVDLEMGLLVGYRRISGGFRWVWRTPEFEGARWDNYGGLFINFGSAR